MTIGKSWQEWEGRILSGCKRCQLSGLKGRFLLQVVSDSSWQPLKRELLYVKAIGSSSLGLLLFLNRI